MTLVMIKKEEFKEGMKLGREEGTEYGIINSIKLMLSVGLDEEEDFAKVAAQYEMSEDEVRLIWEKD